jgi:hypothetical protein
MILRVILVQTNKLVQLMLIVVFIRYCVAAGARV